MEVFRPKLVSANQLTRFHSDDYINFLRLITPGMYIYIYISFVCSYGYVSCECIFLGCRSLFLLNWFLFTVCLSI